MTIKLLRPSAASWQPHGYQKKAMRFLLEHAAAALFLDPGLGKTSITLGAFKVLKKQGVAQRMLVVAPLRVALTVWTREAQKWKDFQGLKVAVAHGKDREKVLAGDADVVVVNPDGLSWLLGAEITKVMNRKGKQTHVVNVSMRRWKQLGFDTLAIDELSGFKHQTSLRYKLLKEVRGTFDRLWGLTGSPAANGLEQLFPQCFMLDGGHALGRYITHFRRQHFLPSPTGFGWQITEQGEKQIYQRLKPLALRMAAEDYLDMPGLLENHLWIQLPDAVQRQYRQLEDELFLLLDEGKVRASNAGVAANKCRQLAGGAVYLSPELDALQPSKKRDVAWLHDLKGEVIEELHEELQGQPLLIAYEYDHEVERLLKRFPRAPVIGGRGKVGDTSKIIADWQAGRVQQVLVQSAAGSHGLDGFQGRGKHLVWHTSTYDYEVDDQLMRRLYRQGASRGSTITVHRVLAARTVDEAVMVARARKKRGQDGLFEALTTYRKSRYKP